ncbi:MAG: hypothetical protein AB7F86_13290 [Bdellovibrionales bacterium]
MKLWIFVTLLVASFGARAEPNPVPVELPVVDAPFNFLDDSFVGPSMRQSLALSTGFYETTHRAIMGDGEKKSGRVWRHFAIAGFDILTTWVPLGSSWLHEEWHRAVMTRRGISSYDDINDFPFGRSLIAVSHVTDDDLVRLKRDHPAEQVRLSAAGMEAQESQNLLIESHQFFHGAPANNRFLLWYNKFGVIGYLATCAGDQADTNTNKQNTDDGSDVGKRDFTGLDCTAWVYDLFRPDEAYATRGTHPSGVGIDRYIRYSDLSEAEKRFLGRQVYLSALNFVDPFLIGYDRFEMSIGSRTISYVPRLSHQITSFGYVVDAHLMVQFGRHNMHFQLHNGFNDRVYFPGFSLKVIEFPLTGRLSLSPSLTIWNQPKRQRYNAKAGELLTAAGLEASYRHSDRLRTFIGVEAKSPGWMAGQVFVDRAWQTMVGARLNVF